MAYTDINYQALCVVQMATSHLVRQNETERQTHTISTSHHNPAQPRRCGDAKPKTSHNLPHLIVVTVLWLHQDFFHSISRKRERPVYKTTAELCQQPSVPKNTTTQARRSRSFSQNSDSLSVLFNAYILRAMVGTAMQALQTQLTNPRARKTMDCLT